MNGTLAGSMIEIEEGKNGWLYIRSAEANFFHSAAERANWANFHLPIFTAQLLGRHARLTALKIPYIVAIAPEKQSVYPENLLSAYQVMRPTMAELMTSACANAGIEAVDLMKLLKLDSSIGARKQLAKDLNYTGNTGDSASMNIWLHQQVMQKLAANGGKVPADLLKY